MNKNGINPGLGIKKKSDGKTKVRHEKAGMRFGPFGIFGTSVHEDGPNGKNDKSVSTLTNGYNLIDFFKNGIRFLTGGLLFSSTSVEIRSEGGVKILSNGDHIVKTINGNIINQNGEMTDEQLQATKKIQAIYDKAEKSKKNAILSTKGDMVPCDTCAQQQLVNKKSGFITRLMKLLRRPGILPYFGYAIDVVEFILNTFVAPILDVITAQALSGESTCGNKGCKNGMIESPQKKLEAGNKAAEKVLNEAVESGEIAKLEEAAGSGGNEVHTKNKNVTINIGTPVSSSESPYIKCGTKNDTGNAKFKKGKSLPQTLWATGEGTIPNVINISPMAQDGFLTINIASKLLLKTGNCGIELLSSGHTHIAGGSVTVVASEGELCLASQNLTTLKGKAVVIDADDRSGSGGLVLKSKDTKVQGALNVVGNIACMGGVTVDGDVAASHFIGRSMRMQTTQSGSTKSITNDANWLLTSQAMCGADTVLQTIQQYIMPDSLLDIGNLYKLTSETFNQIMNSTVVETTQTGFYVGMCLNAAGPGISWGIMPSGGIWNWKHNHTITNQPHTHDYSIYKGDMYDTLEDWGGARPSPSSIPTPATESCMGTKPGPKSLAGACGGGGGGFGFDDPNSRASKARRNRNARFGIFGDDAYGEYDFVNTTPVSGNFGYDDDGNITPYDIVNFNLGFDCPSDIFDNTPITDDDGNGDGKPKDC
jgi:hypothetical protein